MTSHELARELLERPDLPIKLSVGDPKDTYVADVGDCKIQIGSIDVDIMNKRGYRDQKPGDCVTLRGWMSSEEEEALEDDWE